MIPKAKAENLVFKLCLDDCTDSGIERAKKQAVILADEVLTVLTVQTSYDNVDPKTYKYWTDVKDELKKL